ncbi:MAG: hypothetical protein ACM3YE_13905 [Bacteroidota bacterium]
MLFLIRFTYIALLLIFVQLLIPAFRPGGRFFILLIALTTSFCAQIIRKATAGKAPKVRQIPLAGFSVIIILLLSGYYFSGVKPTFLGILATYLGSVLLELLLPNEWYELIYRKYQKQK